MKSLREKKREEFITYLKHEWELPESWDVEPDSLYTDKVCFKRSEHPKISKKQRIEIVISENGFFISKEKKNQEEKSKISHKSKNPEHAAIYTRGLIEGIERSLSYID